MRFIPYYKIAIITVLSFVGMFLFVPTNVWGQTRVLSFDDTVWDFGQIKEDGGEVEHTFTFTNTSSKPVVILDVISGCGCTTPTYSRRPVAVGAKSEIKVAFDPINRPGKFTKSVSIRTSASTENIKLTLEGVVLPRNKSIEEEYAFDLGSGVRISSNFHSFAYVGRGETVSEKIGWVNTSQRDATLRFEPNEESGMLKIDAPTVLKAGGKGEITISYTIAPNSTRYGTLNDLYNIKINGRIAQPQLSTNAIAIDKFDNAPIDIMVPNGELSKKFIKFGEVKRGKSVTDTTVELHNSGETDLIIRAIEWQSKALRCSLQSGDKVKAGGSVRLELTLDTTDCDYDIWVDRLRIITNDPQHPMHSLRITAIVVE